jgi:cysteine desulfurase
MFTLFRKNAKMSLEKSTVKRVYLDHASATPMRSEAIAAMTPFFEVDFGNASAVHAEGVVAKRAVNAARATVARVLGIQQELVTFTSGGTESNNLAILGVVEAYSRQGVAYSEMEIITTAIEHPATQKTCDALVRKGVVIKYVPVNTKGLISLQALSEMLSLKTILVTVSYVNSEIGVVQDIGAISRMIDKFSRGNSNAVLLHVDAAQAPVWLPCELSRLGVDLMSLDGGKFGGGKGVGILARRKSVNLKNISFGGGQEGGLRPGTEPVAMVVAFATALQIVQGSWPETSAQVAAVRDYFFEQVQLFIPGVQINGALGKDRVANNVNVSIPGIDSEFAVISLDVAGVACSTKSACSSAGGGESTVVKAISNDVDRATTTLRFTLGPDTTIADIDYTVQVLKTHIKSIPTFYLAEK